jgi:peptidyl-prolyl cis-trans isomerase NIMA-interacting 1
LLTDSKVAETGLPPGWDILWSATKRRPYYYKENGVKWDSTWEPPEGTNEKKRLRYINQKIEASHLLVKHRESRRTSSWREVGLHVLLAIKLF